jgi:hypothetical protein
LGELASLRKMSTINDYRERFLTHMARAGYLDERQQVNIYTAGLLEPLKTDVELLDPQDMKTAISLAWAYEQRLAVVAEANKAPALKLRRLPPPKGAAAPTSCPFKRLTAEEMAD